MVPIRYLSLVGPLFSLAYTLQAVDQEKFDIFYHEEAVHKKRIIQKQKS